MSVRVLVVQNTASDPVERLGDWLEAAGGRELVVAHPYAGEALPSGLGEGGFGALLVLGGEMGANDDHRAPWLPQVRRLLASAVADEIPTLGVCRGGQLLAAATGGRVALNPQGPEYGAQLIAKRASAATDPLFGPLPITPDVIQWHTDAVVDLPPGAVLLASSPGCDVQAFRIGRLAWGIQFHIETSPEIVRQWADEDADLLGEYDVERILARSDAAHADVAEVWAPFAASWAAVVREPAAVPAGRALRVTTAEPITDPAAIRAALAAEANAAHGHPVQLGWPGPVTGSPQSAPLAAEPPSAT